MKLFLRTLLFFLCIGSAHAATVLTLASISMPEHPRTKACLYFAERVGELSQGRLVVEVRSSASFGDDVAMVQALRDGTLDISANSQGPIAAVVPEFNAFGMPFLFASPQQAWRTLDGPVGQELARRSAAKGLVVLGFWDNGIRHMSNSVRAIRTPKDVAGLRIRTPADPVATDIVAALGGHPKTIRFTELYNALQRGVVDGQENPLINFMAVKLYEVQKYISLTGHKYEVTPFLIARPRWEALSETERNILKTAAEQATRYQRALTQKADDEAYEELVRHGVLFNKVNRKPFVAATSAIYEKWYASPIGDYVRMVVKAASEDK